MLSIITQLLIEYGQALASGAVVTTFAFFKRKIDLKKIKKEQEAKDKLKN